MLMKRPHSPVLFAGWSLSLAMALGIPAAHAGTWAWLDDSGRKIYSDMPPPNSVPDKNILQKPGRVLPSAAVAAEPTTPPAPPSPPGAPAPANKAKTGTPSSTDDPAALKKQQEAKKAAEAERQAQEAKNAQIRAENCRRAQTSMRTLQSGVRMVTTDEQGNQLVLDDAMRATEAERLQAAMQANCN